MTTPTAIVAWLNATYPDRDWDQWCAKLVWNTVWFVSGLEERHIRTYDPAKAAYRASRIESSDPWTAPAGAIHYWQNPSDGHVAVELGDGLVLMTGTPEALGEGGWAAGTNYGVTTVEAYSKARRNPYLGWSYAYGVNPSIVGLINPPDPITPPRRKAKKMLGLMISDGLGKYGPKGQRYFATYDGSTFVELNEADANAVSVHLGEAFANVTYTAWEAYQEAATTVLELAA